MLTNHLIASYNQLLATSLLYFTVVDPLQDLACLIDNHLGIYKSQQNWHQYTRGYALAEQSDSDGRDYYEILGVNKDATKQEIHRAFRQKAKKYHPDKNKEKGAEEEFMKIFKAYETLADEKKRKEYDNRGQGPHPGAGWRTGDMSSFDVHDFFKQYEEQLFRHAQHFDQHHHDHRHRHDHAQPHHQHSRFTFAGVDLDDLFHDIDADEFSSFGRMFGGGHHNHHMHHGSDGFFGDGASFFGSYMPSQVQDSVHHYQRPQFHTGGGGARGYSCQTVTRQVNGMMMTQTSCS